MQTVKTSEAKNICDLRLNKFGSILVQSVFL